jgi:GH25 family lysozyme M1 (1,4-beta-N-acetylmuramidase)
MKPALDLETPFAGLKPAELRIWARTWLDRVKRALGARPIIYTNTTSWALLGDPTSFARAGHPLWVANWDVPVPLVPADNWAGQSWRIWQHRSDGRLDGINGRVDLDWLRGGWRGVTMGGAVGGGVTPR